MIYSAYIVIYSDIIPQLIGKSLIYSAELTRDIFRRQCSMKSSLSISTHLLAQVSLTVLTCFKPLTSIGFLLGQAKKALAKGDDVLLERILGSLEKADNAKKPINENEIKPLKNYKKGVTSRSGLRGFTEYWDSHLKKLDIHLPLIIFNEEWIELDTMVATSNTSKKKEKITGQTPKSEWWLSFSEWTRAGQLMVKYIRDHYKHVDFGNDLEEHFEYVQNLSIRHGWVTAYRYNIAVRTDMTCNHVNGAPGDPSVKREEFLEDALAHMNLLRDGRIMKYDNRTYIQKFFL